MAVGEWKDKAFTLEVELGGVRIELFRPVGSDAEWRLKLESTSNPVSLGVSENEEEVKRDALAFVHGYLQGALAAVREARRG